VVADDPDGLVEALRQAGFDATRGTSAIAAIDPPAEHEARAPVEARRLLGGIVFLPVYPELSDETLDRLAAAVGRAVEARPARSASTQAEVPA
jgi:dTDP-4-amino-4,6-dideoxygalactose transaminase